MKICVNIIISIGFLVFLKNIALNTMKNETAIDDFLGTVEENDSEFKTDGKPFGDDEIIETTETNTPDEEDEKLPYHKDPKVQKFINRQIEKALKEKPTEQKQFIADIAPTDESDLIGAFTSIIGNDTPEKVHALKMLEKSLKDIEINASKKALNSFEEQSNEQKRIEKEVDEYVESSFEDIEDKYGVDLTSNDPQARKMYNEYKSFLRKISPKDIDGNITTLPDIVGSFEFYQQLTKKESTSSKAKELSSKSISRSTATSFDKPNERITFDIVDRLFG